MKQKIILFNKTILQKDFDEAINNAEVQQIIKTASAQYTDKDFNVESVRRPLNRNVSSLRELSSIAQRLKNDKVQDNVKQKAYKEVEDKFPFMIESRGDGNCFYRSFMVNFIIKVVFQQEKEMFFQFIKQVWEFEDYIIFFQNRDIRFTNQQFKFLAIGFLFDSFMKQFKKQMSIDAFISSYNNQPEVDVSLIVICRNFINKYFSQARQNSNQLFIAEGEETNIPNLLSEWATEAQNTIVPFSRYAFKIQTLNVQNLYKLDDFNRWRSTLDQYIGREENLHNISVDVMFTKGHYNILFPTQFSEEFLAERYYQLNLNNPSESGKSKSEKEKEGAISSMFFSVSNFFKPNQLLTAKNPQISNAQQNQSLTMSQLQQKSFSSPHYSQQPIVEQLQTQQLESSRQSLSKVSRLSNSSDRLQTSKPSSRQNIQSGSYRNSQIQQPQRQSGQRLNFQQENKENIRLYQMYCVNDPPKSSKQKPVLERRLNCDFCKARNSDTNHLYDLYYAQICQKCVYQNLFVTPNYENNQQINQEMIYDILMLVKEEKVCLNCQIAIPYQVTIEKKNELPTYISKLLCGTCQGNKNNQHKVIDKFKEFITKNYDLSLIYLSRTLDVKKQTNNITISQPKQQQPKLNISSLLSQAVTVFKENFLGQQAAPQNNTTQNIPVIVDEYRNKLNAIIDLKVSKVDSKIPKENSLIVTSISNETSSMIQSLVEKLTLSHRFSRSCFKCEEDGGVMLALTLKNNGIVSFCKRCIREEHQRLSIGIKQDQSVNIECSLIGKPIKLSFNGEKSLYLVLSTCYECMKHQKKEFIFKFEDKNQTNQICYKCIQNLEEYRHNYNKWAQTIKQQLQQYQRCLGCFKSQHKEHKQSPKDLKTVYLCEHCAEHRVERNDKQIIIFNEKMNEHFQVQKEDIEYQKEPQKQEKQIIMELSPQTDTSTESEREDTIMSTQNDEQDNNGYIQEVLDCPKCHPYQIFPDRLLKRLECSCKDLDKKFKPQSIGEYGYNQPIICKECNYEISNSYNKLESDSLLQQSIIKQNKDFSFKQSKTSYKQMMVKCKNCKMNNFIQY